LRAIREGNSCLLSPVAPDTVRCGFLSFFGEADRWRLRASGAPDTVRCTPDSPVPPPDRWLGHVSRADRAADRWLGRTLAHRTVRCTPDSPVNYSRTPLIPSREQLVRLSQPGAPDTVRCTTGHCPVHHRTVRCTQTELTLAEQSHLISNSIFPFDMICTLSTTLHRSTQKHLRWHSITKILRNGPRAHFPFKFCYMIILLLN
jgi:hypothetical protein